MCFTSCVSVDFIDSHDGSLVASTRIVVIGSTALRLARLLCAAHLTRCLAQQIAECVCGLVQARNWEAERICLLVTLHCGERLMAKNTHSRMSSPYARLVLLNLWQTPPELFCFQVKHDTLHPDWDTVDQATGARVPTECCFTIFRDELDPLAIERDAEKLELVSIDLWDYNAKNSRGSDKFLGRTTSIFEEEKQQKLRLNARSARSRVGVGTATMSMRTASPASLREAVDRRVSGERQGQPAHIQMSLSSELNLAENDLGGTQDQRAGAAPRKGSAGTDATRAQRPGASAAVPAGLTTSIDNSSKNSDKVNRAADSSSQPGAGADLCALATPREVRAIRAMQRTFRNLYGGGGESITPARRPSRLSRAGGGGAAARPTQLAMSMPTAAAVRTHFTYPRDRFEEYIPDVRAHSLVLAHGQLSPRCCGHTMPAVRWLARTVKWSVAAAATRTVLQFALQLTFEVMSLWFNNHHNLDK